MHAAGGNRVGGGRGSRTRMADTMETSSIVGATLKTMDESKKLMPRVPRSIARDMPPVCLDRWKFRSRFMMWPKVRREMLRMERCATFANTADRSSLNSDAPLLAMPSATPQKSTSAPPKKKKKKKKKKTVHCFERPRACAPGPANSHPISSVPAEVSPRMVAFAATSTAASFSFSRSIVHLNMNGTCTFATWRSTEARSAARAGQSHAQQHHAVRVGVRPHRWRGCRRRCRT